MARQASNARERRLRTANFSPWAPSASKGPRILIVIGRAIAFARHGSEEFCHPVASADGSPTELPNVTPETSHRRTQSPSKLPQHLLTLIDGDARRLPD